MSSPIHCLSCMLCILLMSLPVFVAPVFAQSRNSPADQDDVIRISTDLVQTGVMVVDRKGRFVDGLQRDHFEVRVDGKPVTISFFDRVVAGTAAEEKQVAALGRSGTRAPSTPIPDGTPQGSKIIFFVDDRHLSAESLERTRKSLLDFVENGMGPMDQVAIVSSSGQIGFLQQFSDHKAVVRSAIARIERLPSVVQDTGNPPMTDYVALRISQGDNEAITYYTNDMLR